MSQVNKLYRNFIILQEDERGYSTDNDKTLSGYSKIEARGEKCKISFYAQNLRSDSDDYHVLVIFNKKDAKRLVNLGSIAITEGGKAEVTKEYFRDDIAGLGLSYDKISGVAIVKLRGDAIIAVMCGFINGEEPTQEWKDFTLENEVLEKKSLDRKNLGKAIGSKYALNRDDKVKKTNKENQHKQEPKNNQNSFEEESLKKPFEEESLKNNFEEESLKNPFESETLENPFNVKDGRGINEKEITVKETNNNVIDNKEIINKEVNLKETNVKEPINKQANNKFDSYEAEIEKARVFTVRGSVGEYFESIANGFEVVNNVYRDIKHCKWYDVPVNDLNQMCNMSNYNRYTVAYYPMLNYYPYIRKYGHFRMGYKCDREGNLKYIVYGIPGRNVLEEQPYEGKTGFVTWVKDENREGLGCWLMFYDFRNSTVVVPME